MSRDFQQLDWNDAIADDCRQLVRLAAREDLDRYFDLTTLALVAPEARGRAAIVSRQTGIVAGLRAARVALEELEIQADFLERLPDGSRVEPGVAVAEIECSARDLLTAERLLLNLIGRLSGIATLTRKYVDRIAGTRARVYDTRKTTPGWRRLEKYAVRCGGGWNHRMGLWDAILIKDNHLACAAQAAGGPWSAADAVRQAREFVRQLPAGYPGADRLIVEVEVDTLEQFDDVLTASPDIVLLDNMEEDTLREAVARRQAAGVPVELEASGGVNLETIRGIAETGVDRISVGALTHSAFVLDVGLDWRNGP